MKRASQVLTVCWAVLSAHPVQAGWGGAEGPLRFRPEAQRHFPGGRPHPPQRETPGPRRQRADNPEGGRNPDREERQRRREDIRDAGREIYRDRHEGPFRR